MAKYLYISILLILTTDKMFVAYEEGEGGDSGEEKQEDDGEYGKANEGNGYSGNSGTNKRISFHEQGSDGHGSYSYGYNVDDSYYDNHHQHQEKKSGQGSVIGSYSLKEPDGSERTVTYEADWKKGFRAVVSDKNGVRKFGFGGGNEYSGGGDYGQGKANDNGDSGAFANYGSGSGKNPVMRLREYKDNSTGKYGNSKSNLKANSYNASGRQSKISVGSYGNSKGYSNLKTKKFNSNNFKGPMNKNSPSKGYNGKKNGSNGRTTGNYRDGKLKDASAGVSKAQTSFDKSQGYNAVKSTTLPTVCVGCGRVKIPIYGTSVTSDYGGGGNTLVTSVTQGQGRGVHSTTPGYGMKIGSYGSISNGYNGQSLSNGYSVTNNGLVGISGGRHHSTPGNFGNPSHFSGFIPPPKYGIPLPPTRHGHPYSGFNRGKGKPIPSTEDYGKLGSDIYGGVRHMIANLL